MASKSEKMSFVASEWRALNDSDRCMWNNEAKNVERLSPSMLSEEEKRKQIAKCKSLVKEVS